jgi:molybdenum cofactor cytidylyltransferase
VPTAAVILAAGGSTRLGRTKQLEPWGGSNLLGHVVSRTRAFPVEEVWVVLGHDSDRILEETDLEDVGVIENPEWAEGVASSLRVALDALTRLSKCERALILAGDQPEVSAEVVSHLLTSHAKSGKPASVPKYRYSQDYPVVVERSVWARLMSLEGDEDTFRLWQAHPEWVNEVWFSVSHPRGVDTDVDVTDLRPRPIV